MKQKLKTMLALLAALVCGGAWAATGDVLASWSDNLTNTGDGATITTGGVTYTMSGDATDMTNSRTVFNADGTVKLAAVSGNAASKGLIVSFPDGTENTISVLVKYYGYNKPNGWNTLLAALYKNGTTDTECVVVNPNNLGQVNAKFGVTSSSAPAEGTSATQKVYDGGYLLATFDAPNKKVMISIANSDGEFQTPVEFSNNTDSYWPTTGYKGIKVGGSIVAANNTYRPAMTIGGVTIFSGKVTASDVASRIAAESVRMVTNADRLNNPNGTVSASQGNYKLTKFALHENPAMELYNGDVVKIRSISIPYQTDARNNTATHHITLNGTASQEKVATMVYGGSSVATYNFATPVEITVGAEDVTLLGVNENGTETTFRAEVYDHQTAGQIARWRAVKVNNNDNYGAKYKILLEKKTSVNASSSMLYNFHLDGNHNSDGTMGMQNVAVNSAKYSDTNKSGGKSFQCTAYGGQYIKIHNENGLASNAKGWTVSCWVNTGSSTDTSWGNYGLLRLGDKYYQLQRAGTKKVNIYASDTNVANNYEGIDCSDFGTWYHIALVSSGEDVKIYLNGVLNSTYSPKESQHLYGSGFAGLTGFTIGEDASAPRNGGALTDEVAIFAKSLTAGQIAELAATAHVTSDVIKVAEIDGVRYDSLADAISTANTTAVDAEHKVTITLLKACSENANLGEFVTLDPSGKSYTGTLTGSGVYILRYTGTTKPTPPSGVTANEWEGTVWLIGDGSETNATDINKSGTNYIYSHSGSKLALTGLDGYFINYNGTTVAAKEVALYDDGDLKAFTVSDGSASHGCPVPKLTGDGTLRDRDGGANGRGFCVEDASKFKGSIEVQYKTAVMLGREGDHYGTAATIEVHDTALLAEGKSWTAKNGITVKSTGTIKGSGTLASNTTFESGATVDITDNAEGDAINLGTGVLLTFGGSNKALKIKCNGSISEGTVIFKNVVAIPDGIGNVALTVNEVADAVGRLAYDSQNKTIYYTQEADVTWVPVTTDLGQDKLFTWSATETEKLWKVQGDESGTTHTWPTSGKLPRVVIDAAEVSGLVIDGQIMAGEVVVVNSSSDPMPFIFHNSTKGVEGDSTTNDKVDCLNAAVNLLDYNGELGLRVPIKGAITFGEDTSLKFLTGEAEGDPSTAYGYTVVGHVGAIKVEGSGKFRVAPDMYPAPFAPTDNATLVYDAAGSVTGAISGSGKVIVKAGKTGDVLNEVAFSGGFSGNAVEVESGKMTITGSGNLSKNISIAQNAELQIGIQDCISFGSNIDINIHGKITLTARQTIGVNNHVTMYDGAEINGISTDGQGDWEYYQNNSILKIADNATVTVRRLGVRATNTLTISGDNSTVILPEGRFTNNNPTINISEGVTVEVANGKTLGKVQGSGTVAFDGWVPATAALTTSAFTANNWTGTVWLKNVGQTGNNKLIDDNRLEKLGRAGSTVKFTGCNGYIVATSGTQNFGFNVELDGSGWKNPSGGSSNAYVFGELKGTGLYDGTALGTNQKCSEVEKFADAATFEGSIDVGRGNTTGHVEGKRVVIGTDNVAAGGGYITICEGKTLNVAAAKSIIANNVQVKGTLKVAATATIDAELKITAATGRIVAGKELTVACELDGYRLETTKDSEENPTTWTYTVVVEDLVNERTTPVTNSASIEVISIGNNGVQKFSGSGGVQVADLQVKQGGKIIVDPIKMPVYVTGGVPSFAAGSQIALAEAYDENTKGVFTLLAWNGSETISEENLPTFIGHDGAQLSQETYTARVENNVNGAEKTYTVLKVDLEPSVATKPVLTIMPVGDSITEGTSARAAYFGRPNYRSFLMKKLAAEGYDVRSTGLRKTVNMDAADVYMPEAWSWHNGVSGQRLITSPTTGARAGWEQAIETALENSDVPDVITFKIGTNDNGTDVDELFEHWKGVMWRIIKARPATKIVVGTIMDYVGTDWEDSWNNKLREAIGYDEETGTWRNTPGFPANQVYLADLNVKNPRYAADGTTFLNSFEGTGASDLHPTWLGHEKNAEEWLRVIKIALADPKVKVSDSEEDAVYTPNTTSGARNNVGADYLKGFKHVKTFSPNNAVISEPVSYDTEDPDLDSIAADAVFARVGYYMELKGRAGNIRWVWVDVPAWDGNSSVEQLGLPVADGAAYHHKVDGVHIDTNDCGIEKVDPSDDTKSAIVRFTNKGSGYSANASIDGVGKNYGYDGVDAFNSESYGMMQLYRVAPSTGKTTQTLMAFNHWKVADQQEIGIGDFAYHGSPLSGTNYNKFSINYMYTHEFERLNLASYLAQDEAVVSIEFWAKPYEAKIGDGESAQYFETVQSAIDSLGEDADITTIQIIGNPTIPDDYCVVDGHLAWGFKAANTGDSGTWTIPSVANTDIKTSTSTKTRTMADNPIVYTRSGTYTGSTKDLVITTLVDLKALPQGTQNAAIISAHYNTDPWAATVYYTSDKKLILTYDQHLSDGKGEQITTDTYEGLHLFTFVLKPGKTMLYVDGKKVLTNTTTNCIVFSGDTDKNLVVFGAYAKDKTYFKLAGSIFYSCDVQIMDHSTTDYENNTIDDSGNVPEEVKTVPAAYNAMALVDKVELVNAFRNADGSVSIPGAYSANGGALITDPTEIREMAAMLGNNEGTTKVDLSLPIVAPAQTTDANTFEIKVNLSQTLTGGKLVLYTKTAPDGEPTEVSGSAISTPAAGAHTFTLDSLTDAMGEGNVLFIKVKALPLQ